MNGDNVRAISILRSIRNIALDVGSSIGATKESVIEAMGRAISSLDRPTPEPGALPELPEWSKRDDLGGMVPSQIRQAMKAYARAYAEQCRAGVWLPIETAPKDGTEVLLCHGKRVTYGHWFVDEGGTIEHRDLEGRWIGQDHCDGWEGWMSWDGGFTEEQPPTHWMPPPAPPALQSAFADDEDASQ